MTDITNRLGPWLAAKSSALRSSDNMPVAAFDVRLRCLVKGGYSENFSPCEVKSLYPMD
ncbi:MAG: hypothetical protein VX963_12140 [Actinomycetota bacterium]|nr:hypothetical protein [Actinomycetota bacterium]